MEDHETTHYDAAERQVWRSRHDASRTVARGASEARRHRTGLPAGACSADGCKPVCGESIRLPCLVGSAGARPAHARARVFRRPCLAVPERAL